MVIYFSLVLSVVCFFMSSWVYAGPVSILAADFNSIAPGQWSVNVTLRHDDSGWDHYADRWRVVDGDNHVLGDRVLYHPHVNEQPFTRGLSHVLIPATTQLVYIEAHDKVHGWTNSRMQVNFANVHDGRLTIKAH